MEGQGSVWRGLATLGTLFVLTFTLGLPTSLRFVLGRVWKGLAAIGMILLGIRVGLLADYGGPFGLPPGLLLVVGVALGLMWALVFAFITVRAWKNTIEVWRDILDNAAE